MSECDHAPAVNPRLEGLCVKCGRKYEQEPPVDPTRDLLFEAAFLRDVLETAGRLTGIYNAGYSASVNARLAVGKARYGDGDYLSKDNLREVREETPDVATYAMLELQKQRRLGLDDTIFQELRLDLVAAAAYGSVADWYAQRAATRLTEGNP